MQALSANVSRPCISAWVAGSLKGVSKPGEIVWSRVFIEDGKLKADLGRREAIAASAAKRPSGAGGDHSAMAHHACGPAMAVTRDQMMARHKANHIQVAYAPDAEDARKALAAKAAFFREAGLEVFICGAEDGALAMRVGIRGHRRDCQQTRPGVSKHRL